MAEVGKQRQLVATGIVLAVVIGIIVGCVYGGRMLWGSDVGGKCDDDFSCKPHNMCISKRCRRTCAVDADCQASWMCRPAPVSVTQGGDARKGFELTSVKICFSPEAMAPVLARERQTRIEGTKRDVRRQVIILQVTSPPQLVSSKKLRSASFRRLSTRSVASGLDPILVS